VLVLPQRHHSPCPCAEFFLDDSRVQISMTLIAFWLESSSSKLLWFKQLSNLLDFSPSIFSSIDPLKDVVSFKILYVFLCF